MHDHHLLPIGDTLPPLMRITLDLNVSGMPMTVAYLAELILGVAVIVGVMLARSRAATR